MRPPFRRLSKEEAIRRRLRKKGYTEEEISDIEDIEADKQYQQKVDDALTIEGEKNERKNNKRAS